MSDMKKLQPQITIAVPDGARAKANNADEVTRMMKVTRNANNLRTAGYRSGYT